MTQNSNTPATTDKERGSIVYQVAGQDVKLSYAIVRNFLTKGSGNVSDQDLTQFISVCKYNQLNPFLNEAYLVKFGDKPAQMIVSKEALMKRADSCDNYKGIQAGIIIVRDGEVQEVEGCFKMPEDKLVGGWAKVYRADREYPVIARVSLDEYDKKQSTWNEKKSTMISKVAKVQALREAFPTQLGAMYTPEESNIEDVDYEDLSKKTIKDKANKKTIDFEEEEPETPVNEQLESFSLLKVASLGQARTILMDDFGVKFTELTTDEKIYAAAIANKLELVIEKNENKPSF
ncbi:phage recombination protein Bet [Sunxiuqinia indica]|uniref:phage recombination protein Bet n=1 Tax=Sunxiuqinia indica TaxID=2692584 RepID=UPI001359401B|nr:phage recombination protein Bet [Sunxiuqinia indica]